MEIRAKLKHLSVSPRKVRLVANLLKGMRLERALFELEHQLKRAAPALAKLLQSAAANARNNFQVESRFLVVKEMRVDPGPVRKRYRPRAFGRAAPVRHKTSHVSLILETLPDYRQEKSQAKQSKRFSPGEAREVSPEEIKREASAGSKGIKSSVDGSKQKRPSGFVRKIFQRKVI